MIPFNSPYITSHEISNIQKAINNGKLSGDGEFSKKCHAWLEKHFKCKKALLTTSCTHALDLAAILIGIKKGDEVIMPSFTFSSTANAFVLRGAKIIFVDIKPGTMNIDESLLEKAITKRTKAIVPVHYAGVSCEMDKIIKVAKKYNLYIIEDAAQGFRSTYKNNFLGTIGDLGCFSFHETKNIICGEGGAIFVNNPEFIERAEIIREKGTNRSKFLKGEVDKYTWVDIGSSYLPSELTAAFLYEQFLKSNKIIKKRLKLWNLYFKNLKNLEKNNFIELPEVPAGCQHNAHIFYIKVKDINIRTELISFLKKNNIQSTFHYIPLHSSPAGKKFGKFYGVDEFTTTDSERLLRLPMYYNLKARDIEFICKKIYSFLNNRNTLLDFKKGKRSISNNNSRGILEPR